MVSGQKNFHKAFAPVSPVFVSRAPVIRENALLRALLVSALVFGALGGKAVCAENDAAPTATAVKRQAASSQYARAEEQRAALSSKPAEKRTLSEYKQAVAAYHRVTLITPRAPEVPDSLLSIAELYTEMGDRFGRSYYQSAVDTYGFLAREYPTSKFCQDAWLRAGKLQKNQLGDTAAATETYAEFVKRYPRSARRREAQEALAEIALLESSQHGSSAAASPGAAKSAPATRSENGAASEYAVAPPNGPPDSSVSATLRESARHGGDAHSGGVESDAENVPRLRRIRASASGEATRVVIDLEGSVQYSSARISNPDRIFFDLHAARLTPEVARGTVEVDGRLLTAVRMAQNQAGVVRVVLDVNGVKDYTASLSNNPPQLIIDLYGTSPGEAPVRSAKLKRDARMPAPVPVPAEDARANTSPDYGTATDITTDGATSPVNRGASMVPAAVTSLDDRSLNAMPAAVASATAPTSGASGSAYPAPNNGVVTEKSARTKPLKATNTSAKPDLVRPATAPPVTHDGQSTLTRTLGLKIGRIVIDAGHGGHDTGTIGPTGLMEKDLCLDVALRLGKIIQQKLPGADVVYTRSDDTFIPLEERTNIANQAKADLFISIHANSSQDHAARGIETYYLNLRGSPEAMEVAARENATSSQGIHDLQDVVRQIARTEKIDESKEFAEDVQNSLSTKIQKSAKTVKNRGVRKAPFVVLIGADMPSILTEISFLSNPADEQLLKKPEQRQHVAEGIFTGVSSYLESLNSVAFNQPGKATRPRPAMPPSVEQSSNQK
ncbi:MAG: N-acetylmuramoyl-L-alanine amidase [Candidatus Acidiferrum sp.]|jgi:N-acetylmuramoyl-L-alanine amidase